MPNMPERPRFKEGLGKIKDENLFKEINKVPLFMTELPEDEREENSTLSALQSLIYDGPPEEIAENFKNQGNECFKSGKSHYQDAINFYTKALDTDCKDNKIIEACLTNRAAVNLELQNYRRVLNDCAKALKINPKNIKAFYRSAKALYMLDKLDEALDCCDHALLIDPNNLAMQKEKEKCINHKKVLDEKRRKQLELELKKREEKIALEKAIKIRDIQMESTSNAPDSPHSVHLHPESQQLIWPVFFLYPEYKESDFVAAFNEDTTFLDHLEVIFENPAPWDVDGKYRSLNNLQIYFEYDPSNSGGMDAKPKLIKIGKKCILKEALSHPKYIVKNGIPSFIILSDKGSFHDEFISKYKS
nr:12333_t:CDS:2 [Entrophospora candida]